MKFKTSPLIQLLEHIESCAERVNSAHNVMSSNAAIIMFLEEAAFVEKSVASICSEWNKQLPLYEDKQVDYNHWINKLGTLISSEQNLEKYAFSYLAYKYGAPNLRSKNIVNLYTEEVYTKNGVKPSTLPAIETLQTTQISPSACSKALKPIIEILQKIKRLLDNPSQEQYKELGQRMLTDYLAEKGPDKNYELQRNTPPSEYISKMDTEIKRLREYYKTKGLNESWLKTLSKSTLEFDPATVGQIVFSMRTSWDEKDTMQFIVDYSYILLMNNHRIKLVGKLNTYAMPHEHPGYALTFDADKLKEFISENVRQDLFFNKLREVCESINEFQCKDYEFVYILYIILSKEKVLKENTSKNGFFNAFFPNKLNGKLETWRTYGRKISHTYNEYSQKKLSPIAHNNNKDSKYSEVEVLYDSFGKLKQKLPLLTDVEEI